MTVGIRNSFSKTEALRKEKSGARAMSYSSASEISVMSFWIIACSSSKIVDPDHECPEAADHIVAVIFVDAAGGFVCRARYPPCAAAMRLIAATV